MTDARPNSHLPRATRWLALALILAVGASLRFINVLDAGIFSVDEGRYLLDGQSKLAEMQVWSGLIRGKIGEIRGEHEFLLEEFVPEAHARLARHAPFLPKVLFSYLVAGVMARTGFTVWAGNVVEAVFGVLMIWATYLLTSRVRNSRTGLIAAGMLAVSCYHVYFSRNAYPQCTSAFFLLVSVILHHTWRLRRTPERGAYPVLGASGVCAGLAFLANFQAGGALPLLVAIHLLACLGAPRRDAVRWFVAGGAVLAAAFACTLCAAEAATYPLILLFRSQGLDYPHQTFIELLLPRLGLHTSVKTNWQGIALFPYFLWVFEGWAMAGALIAAGVGMWAAARSRAHTGGAGGDRPAQVYPWFLRDGWVYLGAAFAVPWFVFSFKTLQGARTFVYIYPFFVAILAVALDTAIGTGSRDRKAPVVWAAASLVLWVVPVLWKDVEVMRARSAYPDVMRYVAETDERSATASWSAVLRCYLRANALEEGPPYLVSDWQELYYGRYPDQPFRVPSDATPEAEFAHRFGATFLRAELFPGYSRTFDAIRWTRALDLDRATRVRVYDLRTVGPFDPDANPPDAPLGWETYPGGDARR